MKNEEFRMSEGGPCAFRFLPRHGHTHEHLSFVIRHSSLS